MNVSDFYDAIGGDLAGTRSRLMNDERILKYLRRFPQTGDLEALCAAMTEQNWENAFRASHNLKGMALNLGLTPLAAVSSDLCETMRHGAPAEDNSALYQQVLDAYESVVALIPSLE